MSATGTVPQSVNFVIKRSIAKTFMDAVGAKFVINTKSEMKSVSEAEDRASLEVDQVKVE